MHLWGIRTRFGLALLLSLSSCVSTGKLRDGDTAFRLGKYQVAAQMLSEEYADNRNPATRAAQAYRIGQSYDAMNRPGQAADWFGKAYADGYGPDALYAQAQQQKKLEDYPAAIASLQQYLRDDPDRRSEIRREMAVLERIRDQIGGQAYFDVSSLGATNSAAEDFAPVMYEDGAIVFTSGRASAVGEALSEWSGGKFFDLFITRPKPGGGYYDPTPFDLDINAPYHDGTATFTADFTEMVYTQCGSSDKKIDDACRLVYRFRDADGSWSEPEELRFFSDSVNIGHPCFAPDGKRIYFSAAGDPESYGGADLYYVRQTTTAESDENELTSAGWSSPINLGPTINTAGNEVFPSLGPDGTLYFSSDGHPGMGGLDLFSTVETRRVWSRPEPLGYPVNSGADDFGILIFKRTRIHPDTLMSGLFSSSRSGGSGQDDLYSFVLKKAPPPPPRYELRGQVVEALRADPRNPDSEITGYRPLPQASVSLYDLSARAEQGVLETDGEGRFSAQLGFATSYRVSGQLSGYFTRTETVSTEDLPNTPGDTFVVQVELVLEPIPEQDITLRNIYYDFDDTTLRAESFPELSKLVVILQENPTLRVEIGSHTDSRGRTEYNDDLSRGRANSVVAYLVGKGIPAARMEARGYGERRLLNRCADGVECSEEEHQLNRRTTFKVIGELDLESEAPEDIELDPRRRNR
jgi:peptidoglycan-associated lipoprotein